MALNQTSTNCHYLPSRNIPKRKQQPKNSKLYLYIHNTGHRANRGTSILVRNDIPQSQLPIKSKFQAVATQVMLHKTIIICSLYIPPHEQINKIELEKLTKQLTKTFILLDDFNSHSTLWGKPTNRHKRKQNQTTDKQSKSMPPQ